MEIQLQRQSFEKIFGNAAQRVFSAPGRVEVCGNHTDHQHGRVLAAAVDLDTSCIAAANNTNTVRVYAEGYKPIEVDLTDLAVHEDEKDTSAALVRGVAAWLNEHGHTIGGFNGHVASNVPGGAGLSSSAAFEVLMGNVFKGLFDDSVTQLEIAIAGQYAENVYYGKPCGLMDQASSSIGGLTMMDFQDPKNPTVIQIEANLGDYVLCVVNTGSSHADLTDEYTAVMLEMSSIANFFDKKFLRDVDPDDFYSNITALRKFGDRAVLRAMHFFAENELVVQQAAALEAGNIPAFLNMIIQSGQSSMAYLQNVFSSARPQAQSLTLALALSERLLHGKGAWRVHGSGFAGTILAFVPVTLKEEYEKQMSLVFGVNACHFLNIRKSGGMEVVYG